MTGLPLQTLPADSCNAPGCGFGEWLYQNGPELLAVAGDPHYQTIGLIGIGATAGLLAWPLPFAVRQTKNVLRRLLFLDPGETLLGYARNTSYDWLWNPLVRALVRDRLTHTQVVAPTGQAKTSLLLSMIVQDLVEGMTVFVLEAGGNLAKKAVAYARALGRPVYLYDPGDGSAMKWNPLSGDPTKVAEQVVSTLMSTGSTNEQFFKEFSAAMVRNLVYTEAACAKWKGREPTIDSLERFILDAEWRNEQLGLVAVRDERLKGGDSRNRKGSGSKGDAARPSLRVPDLDEGVRMFWEREFYGTWTDRQRYEFTQGLRNQLRNLYGRPNVKDSLTPKHGEPQFRLEDVLSSGGLICMRTSRGSSGEAANRYLSTWIQQRFQMETLDRGENAPPVVAYFDECHIYLGLANEEVAQSASTWIAEVRQNNVGCVFSYQSLKQLPEALRDVLAGGARNKLFSGGLSPDDAYEVQRFMGFEERDVEDVRYSRKSIFLGAEPGTVSRGHHRQERPRYTEWQIRAIPRGRWLYLGVRSGAQQRPQLLKAPRAPSLSLVKAAYSVPRKGVTSIQRTYERARRHGPRTRRDA